MHIRDLCLVAMHLAEALRPYSNMDRHAIKAMAEWDALTWDSWTQPNPATIEDVVAAYDVDTIG